ncbi:MAG: hypothetical protein WC662_02475 [Candidatus Paceibacterota bacterium]|jgi:hypothetical protein
MNWTIISIVEAVIIIVLILLVLFRKIGRPLSEAEAKEKIARRQQQQRNIEARRLAEQAERQREWQKFQEQEKLIAEMPRPVTFVSLSGDGMVGRTLCVQDGNGKPRTLHCREGLLDKAPFFNGLYQASLEPHYYSKRGAVLLQ